jgi:hypothetical protein
MLRTVVVLLVLCLVGAVAGTALTGQFWLTLVAVAGALVLGATALSLVRMSDDEEADGGADVRPLTPPRRLPGSAVTGKETDGLGRAA